MGTSEKAFGTLLHDPDCGFCTASARWLVRRGVRARSLPITPVTLARFGVDARRAQREVPFVRPDGTVTYGARAIADALATTHAPWRFAGQVLGWAPVQLLAAPVYRLVAANRHRLPGGTAQCRLPAQSRMGSASKDGAGSERRRP